MESNQQKLKEGSSTVERYAELYERCMGCAGQGKVCEVCLCPAVTCRFSNPAKHIDCPKCGGIGRAN